MNFCATCGRQRTGDARFCPGCGTEFPPGTEGSAGAEGLAGAEATRMETAPSSWAAPDDTRVERQPDPTMIDTQGAAAPGPPPTAAAESARPDPFASWFAQDPAEPAAPPRNTPPGHRQPGGPWQSADTVYAAPGQRAPAYAPPQPPPYGGQPAPYGGQPAPPADSQRPSGGRRAAFIVVVVLVMLAAGGGAYALVSRSNQHNTAQPPASTATAKSSATGGATGSASASSSPPASASPTTSASASASPGVVSLGPGVASNPAEPAVEQTLTDYFQGINTHNYAEYASSLDPQQQASEPAAAFESGYSSTSDSGMKLITLTGNGSGGLTATVTFTSHQAAGTGVDKSPCNNWTLNFYLVKQGAGYVKSAAPAGYQPTYSDC
jgi:hypothetical protein